MAQNYDYNFDLNNNAQDDLRDIERTFDTLRTNFSGVASPGDTTGGQFWFGGVGATGENRLLLRNALNTGWFGVMLGDQYQRMWVYRLAAQPTMDGWIVDASVSDAVAGIKGGTVYDTTGVVRGSWVSTAHQHGMLHVHEWANSENSLPPFENQYYGPMTTFDQTGATRYFDTVLGSTALRRYVRGIGHFGDSQPGPGLWSDRDSVICGAYNAESITYYTNPSMANTEPAGGLLNWRPTAAVGEIQFLDLAA